MPKLRRQVFTFLWSLVRALFSAARQHSYAAASRSASTTGFPGSQNDPNAPSAESRREGRELTDVNPRTILFCVVGLFVVILIAMAALGGMYTHIYNTTAGAMPVKPLQDTFRYGSRAQTSIAGNWEAIDAEARRNLDSYGWVDRAHGVVRVPVGRAVELVTQEGLPARAGHPTPAFPPPDQTKLPLMTLEANADATKFDPR